MNKQVLKSTIFVPAKGKVFLHYVLHYIIMNIDIPLFCFVQLYRQDCETFRTVVKMLVAKEPMLDNLLQAPLDENLLEIKQRCLDDLRHFVKELDEVLEASGRKTLNMESYSGDQSFFFLFVPGHYQRPGL